MHKRLLMLLALTSFWAGVAMAQTLVQTKMDFEDLAPIALPDFGHTGDQKPLTTTPEGANARFFQCRVLKNSPQVPGDATTVVGSATGTQPFGLEFGETIQAGFGQPVSEVTFTLINNITGGIIGGRAVTGQTFRIFAQDNAFHSQTQQVTLGLVQTVKVTISLPNVRFISVTPLPVNGPIIPVLYWRYFLDDFEFKFQPLDTSRFQFTLPAGTPQKVLIHKYRSDDGYPSPLQQHDRQITVDGFVTNSANVPIAGKTVYFRMIDPPDPSPYVVAGGDSRAGDNVDGAGTLNAFSAVSDASGHVSVDLTVTDHVAGDNYQLEASLDPSFNCGSAGCPKSATYTAWKRVYVEVNKMFRHGAFLTADTKPGDRVIQVDDVRSLPNPPFNIRLLHAPPVEGTGAYSTDEVVRVVGINARNGGMLARLMNQANPGELLLDSDPSVMGLRNAYAGSDTANGMVRPYLADAIGVVTGNRSTDFYLANGGLVNNIFAEAFVEYVWLTDAGSTDTDLSPNQPRLYRDGVFPFRRRLNETEEWEHAWMTRKWLQSAARKGKERDALPNCQSMFIGARYVTREPRKPPADDSQRGLTYAGSGFNETWMFTEALGPSTVVAEAVVHELAHQWRVNPSTTFPGGHCDSPAPTVRLMYNHQGNKCTMTSSIYGDPEASDGIVGFHYFKAPDGKPDSEYLRIRQRLEPIPQNDPPNREVPQ